MAQDRTGAATLSRTIRVELAIDPVAYARLHGVEVWQALDHAEALTRRRLGQLEVVDGIRVKRAAPFVV